MMIPLNKPGAPIVLLALIVLTACGSEETTPAGDTLFTLMPESHTGAGFVNHLDYDEQLKKKFNIYTYRNFYNGGGVALGDLGVDPAADPPLVDVVTAQQERAQSLVEMARISAFFYRDFEAYDEPAARKHLRPVAREPLLRMRAALESLGEWTPEALHQAVVEVAGALDMKMGKVAQPLRVAVVGRAASPGIDVTLHLVGREACMRRIDRALEFIQKRMDENAS